MEKDNNTSVQLGELKSKMEIYNQEHGRIHVENREDIKALVKTGQDILIQTTKTNGRVTSIESFIGEQYKINSKLNGLMESHWKRLEEQEHRHSYAMGVLKVLGVLGGLFLMIGGYLFTLVVKDITRSSVKEELSQYEITIQ